jgi:O-antigen/teichoic acid export membrane protein
VEGRVTPKGLHDQGAGHPAPKDASPTSWAGRRGIGATTFVNLLVLGLGLVSSVTSARSLGPEGRGIFSIAWAVSGFAVVVLGLGLTQAFAYFVAKNPRSARDAWMLTVYCAIGLGVPVAVLGALVIELTVADATQAYALMLGLVALPFAIISTDITGILQGLRSAYRFNLSRLITPVAFAGLLLVWAVTRSGSAVEAIGVYVLATALGMAGSVALARDQIGGLHRPAPGFVQAALRYGLVVSISSVAYVANRQLLLIALALVASAADVGLFAVAMGYALPVSVAATAIALHTMPEIAATVSPDAQEALGRGRISVTIKTTVLIGAMAVVVAPILIPLTFGDAFSDAVGIAQILVGAQAVFAVGFMLEETSRGLGKPAFPALAEGAGLVATVIATVMIVPSTGLTGAAVAVLAVNSVVAVVMYWRLHRYFRNRNAQEPRD